MYRQRSFSFKPSRFLVFSFTISSSVILLTFFAIWVYKPTPLILQETNFEFSRTSPGLGHSPLTVHSTFTRNLSASNLKRSILTDASPRLPANSSYILSFVTEEYESEEQEEEEEDGAEDGNFSSLEENIPVPETSRAKVEVISTEKTEEKNIRATSAEKMELPTSEKIAKKNEAASPEKAEGPKEGLIEQQRNIVATSTEDIKVPSKVRLKTKSPRECDITRGRWVYDESYPLYTNNSCPFIDEGFDCVGNGRLDKDYLKWRWQPQDCHIPRFNATKMLDLIRGKRLVFVGDSINRNQWESMLCLLMGAIKDPKRVYETHGRRITKGKGNYCFKFVDYQCTVEYYVSHFLVHESKARIGQKRVQTLRIDAIDHGSSRWRGADILIFNTAHWWSHFKTKAGINYYQEGNQVHPKLDVSMAFSRALMTWASWVNRHINPRKTQVFFRSSAPSHFRGGQWNSGGHCTEATLPLNETSGVYSEKNSIIEQIIKHMKTPVTFLNITSLSELRIDGHPSVYGKTPGKHSSRIQDCSHWCLPGIPDTWNELLYFHLQSRHGNSF